MKRKWIIIGAVVVVVAVVILVFVNQARQAQKQLSESFQTATVERGTLTALVGATGTVRPDQSSKIIWETSGTVGKVHVKVGDKVKANTILAELTPTSLSQSVILAEADLVTAKRNLADLKDSEVARAQAELTLAQAREAYDDAKDKRASKEYGHASQATIDAARANYVIAQNSVDTLEENYGYVIDRPEDDPGRAAMLSQLAAAKQERDRALANLNWLLAKPDEIEIAQADANLALASAKLKDAEREWDRLKDGVDPEDIAAAQARVTAIEATLDTAHVETSFAGTVTEVNAKVGDRVAAGAQAFRVDDLSHLLVDVEITEVDINRIAVGQKTTLTFDAVQDVEYEGKVVEAASVGTLGQGVVNFIVTVEISDPDAAVRPGMTAAVNIVVKQLDDVLLVPSRAVRIRNGKHTVYTLLNNLPVPHEITLGATSDISAQILSGDIKEGDVIILNPPQEMMGPMMMD